MTWEQGFPGQKSAVECCCRIEERSQWRRYQAIKDKIDALTRPCDVSQGSTRARRVRAWKPDGRSDDMVRQ